MTPTTEDLAQALEHMHTILHVAAGHPADDEADADTLRLMLPKRDTLRAAAARLRELDGALKLARGWVVTCSESATARRDLKLIDRALGSQLTEAHSEP